MNGRGVHPLFRGRGEAFGMRIMPGRPLEKCGGGVGRRISASAWDVGMEKILQIGMGPIDSYRI